MTTNTIRVITWNLDKFAIKEQQWQMQSLLFLFLVNQLHKLIGSYQPDMLLLQGLGSHQTGLPLDAVKDMFAGCSDTYKARELAKREAEREHNLHH
jgi:hypothetical protein